MRAVRWHAVILLAMTFGIAHAQQNASANKARVQVGTESRPFVVTVQPREEDKIEVEKRDRERQAKAKTDEALVNWTRILAWLAGLQFLALVTQAAIFLVQSKRLKETIQSQERSERAYMFAEVRLDENLVPTHEGTALSRISVNFWNYGRTPAEVIRIRGYGLISPRTPQQLVDTPEAEKELPPGLGIAENVSFPVDAHVRVTHADLGEIEQLNTTLYCVGRIDYRDIFGELHQTGFCWQFRPTKRDFIITRDSQLNKRT